MSGKTPSCHLEWHCRLPLQLVLSSCAFVWPSAWLGGLGNLAPAAFALEADKYPELFGSSKSSSRKVFRGTADSWKKNYNKIKRAHPSGHEPSVLECTGRSFINQFKLQFPNGLPASEETAPVTAADNAADNTADNNLLTSYTTQCEMTQVPTPTDVPKQWTEGSK